MAGPIAAPAGFLPAFALVFGAEGGIPTFVDLSNPLPVGGAALDLIDTDLDTVNAQLAALIAQGSAPFTSVPHDELDALLDLDTVPFDFSTSGDHVILPGTTAKTIRVHGLVITASAANVLTFKNVISLANGAGANGGTIADLPFVLSGPGGGLPRQGRPWFTYRSAADFVINFSAAQRVAGWAYVKVA